MPLNVGARQTHPICPTEAAWRDPSAPRRLRGERPLPPQGSSARLCILPACLLITRPLHLSLANHTARAPLPELFCSQQRDLRPDRAADGRVHGRRGVHPRQAVWPLPRRLHPPRTPPRIVAAITLTDLQPRSAISLRTHLRRPHLHTHLRPHLRRSRAATRSTRRAGPKRPPSRAGWRRAA